MNIYDLIRPKRKTEFRISNIFAEDVSRDLKTVLTVDATLEIEQSTELTPSEHPIEQGNQGFINDHLDLKPLHLSIKGKIANELLDFKSALVGSFSGAAGGVMSKFATPIIGQFFQTKLSAELTEATDGTNRAKRGLLALMALQEQKIIVSIISKLRNYDNLIIEGLTCSATEGDDIDFSVSLREIKIVKTSQVTIETNVKVKSGVDKKNKGIESTKPLDSAKRDKTFSKWLKDNATKEILRAE